MGAVFAGIVRAPMTSVLIIFEMTRGYGLVLPLMIANMSAFALARALEKNLRSYDALLEQDGIYLHGRPGAAEPLQDGDTPLFANAKDGGTFVGVKRQEQRERGNREQGTGNKGGLDRSSRCRICA